MQISADHFLRSSLKITLSQLRLDEQVTQSHNNLGTIEPSVCHIQIGDATFTKVHTPSRRSLPRSENGIWFLPEGVAQDRQALGRFRREAKTASASTIPIHDIGERMARRSSHGVLGWRDAEAHDWETYRSEVCPNE